MADLVAPPEPRLQWRVETVDLPRADSIVVILVVSNRGPAMAAAGLKFVVDATHEGKCEPYVSFSLPKDLPPGVESRMSQMCSGEMRHGLRFEARLAGD